MEESFERLDGTTAFPRTVYLAVKELGTDSSTALTMAGLYDGWPADHLLQMCTLPEYPQTLSVRAWPRNRVAARRGTVLRAAADDLGAPDLTRKDGVSAALSWTVQSARIVNENWAGRVSRRAISTARAFQPHVIHAPVVGVNSMKMATRISHLLGVPVVPHFLDDWLSTQYLGAPGEKSLRRNMEAHLRALLRRSPCCLVIGPGMKAEYEERFQRECVIAGGTFKGPLLPERPLSASGTHELRYIGKLLIRRAEVAARVAAALPDGWRLAISAPDDSQRELQRLLRDHPNIVDAGTLRAEEVPRALADADALLFVEADGYDGAALTRLSVSGKVAQYLQANRPTVVVGPPAQGSVQALMTSVAAVHLPNDFTTDQLREAIDALSRPVRSDHAATDVLMQLFGRDAVSERFRKTLSAASLRSTTRSG